MTFIKDKEVYGLGDFRTFYFIRSVTEKKQKHVHMKEIRENKKKKRND